MALVVGGDAGSTEGNGMNAPQWNGDDNREDACTDSAETCECPDCRKWRDNREPGDREWEPAPSADHEREQQAEILRTLK